MKAMGNFVSSGDASMMSGEIDTQHHTTASTERGIHISINGIAAGLRNTG
jgi:phosphoenolpyruvate carboxylase